MYKVFLSLLLFSTITFAGLINGIALTVNEEPITLYDIDKTSLEKNVNKEQAASILIDEVLYKQQLKNYGINVDIFELEDYIKKLADANKMDVYAFKSLIRQKYTDYTKFEEEVKQNILREKLIERVVKNKLPVATDEDIELYYNNNKEKFTSYSKTKAVQYSSTNKDSIHAITNNPLLVLNDVKIQRVDLNMHKLNAKLKFLVNSTKIDSFTKVFISNKNFITLLILKKTGYEAIPLKDVKDKIFMDLMGERQKKYLKEYFDKQKLTAEIKVIR
jgi:parvulin-like peptidyl-prolyl isomerase